ncbi:MAG: cytochrome c3 family protein [Draconibacterium sp.]|nr:cytochrome c3 family protein [Draconibacterium sp.]
MKKSSFLLVILIYSLYFGAFGQTENAEKSCIDCHSGLLNQPFIHVAAEDDCANCHLRNENKHPQANVKGFSLQDELPQLCFICHEEYTKSHIHPPAEEGECLMCHSPHASGNKSLLLNNQPYLCSQCHDLDIDDKKFKHIPVFDGNCQTCHDPHQSNFPSFLKKEKSKICADCHENIKTEFGLKNIHPPFENDCANCHASHASNNEKLLIERTPDLCFNCHTDIQSGIESSLVVHKVINDSKNCANCHASHASNQYKLLIQEEKQLCLSCHNKTIITKTDSIKNIKQMLKKGNHIHSVIESDGCVICHNPHYSDNQQLLVGKFPSGNYTNGESENFELCFFCHDSGLMENKIDSTVTNFRNGSKNLHFVHLKGPKGRNCNLCHNVHGSVNEYHLMDKIKFGNWEMPLQFKSVQNGGTCNTGCHEKKSYFRQSLN